MHFNKLLFSCASVCALLIGCSAPLSVHDGVVNGSDKFGISANFLKEMPNNKNCFYTSERPRLPAEQTYMEFQYVALKVNDLGQIRRYEVTAESDPELYEDFQSAQDGTGLEEGETREDKWRKAISQLRTSSGLVEMELSVPPRKPNPKSGQQPSQQNRNPFEGIKHSPLDISLNYYTQLYFVLIDEGWSFDVKTPFLVASKSRTGNVYLAPFYGPIIYNSGDDVISMEYYRDEEKIKNPHCFYDYELHVNIQEDGRSNKFVTKIIIDPKGGANGTPPPP